MQNAEIQSMEITSSWRDWLQKVQPYSSRSALPPYQSFTKNDWTNVNNFPPKFVLLGNCLFRRLSFTEFYTSRVLYFRSCLFWILYFKSSSFVFCLWFPEFVISEVLSFPQFTLLEFCISAVVFSGVSISRVFSSGFCIPKDCYFFLWSLYF